MKFTQLFILQSAMICFFGNLRARFTKLNPLNIHKQISQGVKTLRLKVHYAILHCFSLIKMFSQMASPIDLRAF